MQAFSSEQSIKIETKARKWGGEGARKNLAHPFSRLVLLSASREALLRRFIKWCLPTSFAQIEKKKGQSNNPGSYEGQPKKSNDISKKFF